MPVIFYPKMMSNVFFILIDPSSGQDVDSIWLVSAIETTDTNIMPWFNDSVSFRYDIVTIPE